MPSKLRRMNEPPAESRIFLWHFNAIIVGGNALLLVANTSQVFNFLCDQNPPAVNDSWRHPVFLKRGTYTLDMLVVKGSGSGILTLNIWRDGGSSITYTNTFDLYSAGTVFNTKLQDTAVTIDKDGFYDVAGTMNTKNVASAGYTCFLNFISLYRTGD